ncbi:MAG: cytochrome c biogenesis protein CcdA [Bacteroidota bacterium]|nr:cytochrome c biogenesis protein CcdA [Bacteroidota bacterium]MDP4193856.1 cytochrome c biogenesis protein CcdA [Bacteroidota bacterium]
MNPFRIKISLFCLFLFITIPAIVFGQDDQHVKIKTSMSVKEVKPGDDLPITVKVSVDDSWHINSNKPNEDFLIPSKLNISSKQKTLELKSVKYPQAKNLKLGFSDTPLSVFEGTFTVSGVIKVSKDIKPGKYPISIVLDYQSCNNSTCLPPNSAKETIQLVVAGAAAEGAQNDVAANAQKDSAASIKSSEKANNQSAVQTEQSSAAVTSDGSSSLASKLESSGLFLSLLIVFLGGLALNLTPCVYPLIPITVGYFGGQSEGRTGKLFLLGLLYVLGMALTYSVIGVVTALSGAVFGTLLQNTFVILAIVAVLIALSLSMFGVYEFKLPDSLVAKAGGAKGGYFGAFFMGLTIGIVAAPCIGPFVLGLVTYVGTKADPYFGFLMFFFLAVGMGVPYLVLALFSGKIKQLPRAGFWMEAVKHIFGFMLLGMAIYFLEPILPKNVAKFILPIYMILAACYIMVLDKAANNVKGFRAFKTIFSVLIIGVSVYMLLPEKKTTPEWQFYTEEAYRSTLTSNKPMVIDFYADWCIPCKELDGMTFSNPKVIEELKRFGTYKVDMTKSLSPQTEAIRNKFKIVGMPTVLVINSKGEEVHRITGFVNADKFHGLINSVE